MSKLFETKFKVMPVYQNEKKCGFMVYHKSWFMPFYFVAQLDIIGRENQQTTGMAYFKTMEDATDYIESRKKVY